MSEKEDLWMDIPSYAWVSLARRGMEKISLDQCFIHTCDNEDPKLLEPFKKEESEDEKVHTKIIHIKCKKCNGIFKLKLDTHKRVAKPTNVAEDKADEGTLSMGMIYALDEEGNNLGHIGYF